MESYYRARSLWLERLPESLTPRTCLAGEVSCDVGVVGAGFGGLWTAYYLTSLQPDLRVCVVEQEIAGFGPAGRNGGWVSSGIAGKTNVYAKKGGLERVRLAELETYRTVDEIGRVIEEERIDCDYLKAGALALASTAPQRRRLIQRVNNHHQLGLTDSDLRLLSGGEVREHIAGAANVLAGSFTPHCARVDPARLARGLAVACERRGVKIYERTKACGIEPGVIHCQTGTLRAEIVLQATEAYTICEPTLSSRFLPVYSLMIATEPLADETWEELGWRHGVTAKDQRHIYYYAQRTSDGRVAIGGRGAPYRLRHPISEQNERNDRVKERLVRTLYDAFPATRGARITHQWGGPLAVPRDWCMSVTFDRATGVGWTGGYGGHGLVAANIGGRTLADLVLFRDTELLSLPWVGHRNPRWEPEPMRALASWLIAKTCASADRHEDNVGTNALRAKAVAPFMPPP